MCYGLKRDGTVPQGTSVGHEGQRVPGEGDRVGRGRIHAMLRVWV